MSEKELGTSRSNGLERKKKLAYARIETTHVSVPFFGGGRVNTAINTNNAHHLR